MEPPRLGSDQIRCKQCTLLTRCHITRQGLHPCIHQAEGQRLSHMQQLLPWMDWTNRFVDYLLQSLRYLAPLRAPPAPHSHQHHCRSPCNSARVHFVPDSGSCCDYDQMFCIRTVTHAVSCSASTSVRVLLTQIATCTYSHFRSEMSDGQRVSLTHNIHISLPVNDVA